MFRWRAIKSMGPKKMEEEKVDVREPVVVPDEQYELRTCCGQLTSCDKPLCTFLAKFAISSVVLGFCMVQLVQGNGDSAFYSSTVSLILGTYLSDSSSPEPRRRKA